MSMAAAVVGPQTGLAGLPGRPSISIARQFDVVVSDDERGCLAELAQRLRADEPALASTDVFGPFVEPGLGQGPAVVIGDHREISLSTEEGAQIFEYRISHLAAAGDLLLVSGSRSADFESYREHTLRLGPLEILELPDRKTDGPMPLALRCRRARSALGRLVESARAAGEFTVIPYIGMGHVWLLAAAVAEQAQVPVRVAAPPPRLTRRVNDKIWFGRRVHEVLGRGARPQLRAAYGPAALAAHVGDLARRSERVAVKVPDSAGSIGNISLASRDVAGLTFGQLRVRLLALLHDLGWRGRFPLLVEVWDSPVLSSPSVQVWVPLAGQGEPIIEGIFEQIVEGPEGTFVGSVPTTLTDGWNETIAGEAARIAVLLQELGYFGRCSFDAVIAGRDLGAAELHWIECNGRWGGVSIPMTLTNRLVGDWQTRAFVVAQRSDLALRKRRFADALSLLGRRLYQAQEPSEGVILLSPLGIERGLALHLMAIADTVEGAKELALDAVRTLT